MSGADVHGQPRHRAREERLAFLPALVFALYPLSIAVAGNIGVLPLSLLDIGRIALAACGATALLLWPVWAMSWDRVAVGMWLSCLMLVFVSYGPIVAAALPVLGGLTPEDGRLALAHTAVSVLIATAVIRPWQALRRDPIPLNIVATVMLSVNIVLAISRGTSTTEASWRDPADALTESIAASPEGSPHTVTRDIYYIVLDGLGRPDVLRQYYDLDLDSFVSFLKAKGFYVPDQAHSNYSQTFLSIASTLNFNYLDDVAAAIGVNGSDRRPLGHLIRSNALMRIAHDVGYEVIGISSDYSATMQFDRADSCACQQHGLGELEQAILAATPLGALPLGRWTHDAHRRKVLESFDALDAPRTSDRRTLVFAHIIAPHPPFIFGADGSRRQPAMTMFGFRDGSHFVGSRNDYVRGYRDQMLFVTERLRTIIEDLLRRPGPAPVIVFHGDHGPGSMLRWEDAQASNLRERLGIFAAYYFPDDGPRLYPTLSPVNGARALASRYLGVDLPFLPERSSFSTWSRPYDFVPVPLESAKLVGSR